MRAKYVFSLHDVDTGWTYSKTEGVASPSLAVEPVQLLDGAKVTWGYDKYPGQLVPTQITVALLVATAGDLPDVSVGDYFDVSMKRPAAAGPDLVWFSDRFVADEPVVVTHERGLELQLTLVQWMRDLGEMTVTWFDSVLQQNVSSFGFDAISALISFMASLTTQGTDGATAPVGYDQLQLGMRWLNSQQSVPRVNFAQIADATQFLQLLQDTVEGVGHNRTATADQLVLRLMTPAQMAALDIANGGDGADSGTWYDHDWPANFASAHWWLYVNRIGRTGTVGAALQLVAVGNVVQRQGITGSLAGLSGLVVSGDDVLADNVEFRKTREDNTNQVALKGKAVTDFAGAKTEDRTEIVGHADLMGRYGATTRTVESHIDPLDLHNAALSLLPSADDALPRWGAEAFTWTTAGLTDAELDHYATLWYPPEKLPDPAAGNWFRSIAIPIAIVNIDPALQAGGPLLTGHLTGAVLTISGGEVTVQGKLSNRHLPTSADALTWAQLRASGVSGAKYRAAAGLEWDATGHAGTTQLAPADLRQVKA